MMNMKTREDVFVTLNDGRSMRWSEYIEYMQKNFDGYNWISDEELARIRKEEEMILAQK